MTEILHVNHATFSYGKKLIFENVEFKVAPQEVVCLLGRNGSGKSTMIESLMGMKSLNEGTIFINGKNIRELKPQEIAHTISYVPQLHQVPFPFEVIDIVLMGRAKETKFYSSPSKEDYEIAEHSLDLVGMSEFKNRFFTELSGGEKQLVMIARALAQQTPLIIMDEPTAHLDIHHEQQVLDTVIYLVQKLQVSILMATHAPNHAFLLANEGITTKVAILSEKKMKYWGEPKEVLNEEILKEVFQIHAKVMNYQENGKEYDYILPLSRGGKN